MQSSSKILGATVRAPRFVLETSDYFPVPVACAHPLFLTFLVRFKRILLQIIRVLLLFARLNISDASPTLSMLFKTLPRRCVFRTALSHPLYRRANVSTQVLSSWCGPRTGFRCLSACFPVPVDVAIGMFQLILSTH